jgi:hypothetical protein
MVDTTGISAIVAAVGVLVGVVLTVLELRHLAKSRRTDSLWRILSSFNSKEYLEAYMKVLSLEFKDYDDFTRKYGDLRSGKCEVGVPFRMVCNLFETAGFLFHNGLIEYEIVSQFPVTVAWEKVKPIVEGFRKEFNFPQSFEWFEYLYNEMKKGDRQRK